MPRLIDDVDDTLAIKPPVSLTWKEGVVAQIQKEDTVEERTGLVCGSFGIANFGSGDTLTHLPTSLLIKEVCGLTPGQIKKVVAILVAQLNWSKVTQENLKKKCPRWIHKWLKLCGEAKVCLDPEEIPELKELAH